MPRTILSHRCRCIVPTVLFIALTILPSPAAETAGNPIFPGWYADPEGVIYGNEYWIYPTYSAPYDQQVFLDAFSSPDLVTWTKHSRILDTNAVTWARRAMWAPAAIENGGRYFLFFSANDIQRTINSAAALAWRWRIARLDRSRITSAGR
jgi:beta-xylosidase